MLGGSQVSSARLARTVFHSEGVRLRIWRPCSPSRTTARSWLCTVEGGWKQNGSGREECFEQLFRTAKSLLDTRPIFHKTDATICGHVFCSFLALVLRDELFRRMDNAGVTAEWDDILRDLNALTETAITYNGKTFVVRSNAVGVAGKIAQCVGVRLPNTVRQVDVEKEVADPSL